MSSAPHARGERGGELPPPPAPDLDFYVEHLAPWVEKHCVSCHSVGGGRLRLSDASGALSPAARYERDFRALVRFVRSDAPWESPLVLKCLEPADGGDEHVGGAFFGAEDETHDMLLDFVAGATLTNLPPEVWFAEREVRGTPGKPVLLDGRDAYDRDRADMERLAYHWEIVARPADSQVRLVDRHASRLELVPDTGGSYVVRLRVGDGKVWSAGRTLTIEVFDRVTAEEREVGGYSGLADLDLLALRRVRRLYLDVLGRPPTPGEAAAEANQGARQLTRNLMRRAEAGRVAVEEAAWRLGLAGDFAPEGQAARDLALRVPAEGLPPWEIEATLVRDPSFVRRHPVGEPLRAALLMLLALDDDETLATKHPEAAAIVDVAGGVRSATLPDGRTLASVPQAIDALLASEAFALAAAERGLARVLGPDAGARRARAAWHSAGEDGEGYAAFVQGLLTRPGYLDRSALRPKGRLTLIRSLFVDLLERKPTDREMTMLLRASARLPGSVAPFTALAKILIDSGQVPLPLLVDIRDAPRWLRDRFLRYLGRLPSMDELEAYGKALLDPDGGVELVVQALLTNVEYACR